MSTASAAEAPAQVRFRPGASARCPTLGFVRPGALDKVSDTWFCQVQTVTKACRKRAGSAFDHSSRSAGPVTKACPRSIRTQTTPPGKLTSVSPSPRRADLDRSQLLLDQVAADPRLGHPLADADPHLVGAGSVGEPAGGNPRPVSGQLGPGAVGIPDCDLGFRTVGRDDLEHAVRLMLRRELARALRRQPFLLDEQVDVAVRGPFRGSHRRPHPAGGRPRR